MIQQASSPFETDFIELHPLPIIPTLMTLSNEKEMKENDFKDVRIVHGPEATLAHHHSYNPSEKKEHILNYE